MEPSNTKSGLTAVQYIGRWSREHDDNLQSPESAIESLFKMLVTYTLEPDFERYGGFIDVNPQLVRGGYGDYTHIHGNFFDYSFVFNIETQDSDLVERFRDAIQVNMMTDKYIKAKREREEQETKQLLNYRRVRT